MKQIKKKIAKVTEPSGAAWISYCSVQLECGHEACIRGNSKYLNLNQPVRCEKCESELRAKSKGTMFWQPSRYGGSGFDCGEAVEVTDNTLVWRNGRREKRHGWYDTFEAAVSAKKAQLKSQINSLKADIADAEKKLADLDDEKYVEQQRKAASINWRA